MEILLSAYIRESVYGNFILCKEALKSNFSVVCFANNRGKNLKLDEQETCRKATLWKLRTQLNKSNAVNNYQGKNYLGSKIFYTSSNVTMKFPIKQEANLFTILYCSNVVSGLKNPKH